MPGRQRPGGRLSTHAPSETEVGSPAPAASASLGTKQLVIHFGCALPRTAPPAVTLFNPRPYYQLRSSATFRDLVIVSTGRVSPTWRRFALNRSSTRSVYEQAEPYREQTVSCLTGCPFILLARGAEAGYQPVGEPKVTLD